MGEALDSRIHWIEKMACGYRNRENFRDAICSHLGGLDLDRELLEPTHSKA